MVIPDDLIVKPTGTDATDWSSLTGAPTGFPHNRMGSCRDNVVFNSLENVFFSHFFTGLKTFP